MRLKRKGWALWDRFTVPNFDRDDEDYLRRLRIIEIPWFGILLHRIGTPDSRPTLHDHPWNFVSIVLRGGYVERIPTVSAVTGRPRPGILTSRHVRWVNVKRAEGFHYIKSLDRTPTWTLMLVGRHRRVWGYLDADGTWTRFDEHPHDGEFQAAVARRQR